MNSFDREVREIQKRHPGRCSLCGKPFVHLTGTTIGTDVIGAWHIVGGCGCINKLVTLCGGGIFLIPDWHGEH